MAIFSNIENSFFENPFDLGNVNVGIECLILKFLRDSRIGLSSSFYCQKWRAVIDCRLNFIIYPFDGDVRVTNFRVSRWVIIV